MPPESGEIEPQSALQHVASVSFGSGLGVNRSHRIGLNSFDDLDAQSALESFVAVLIVEDRKQRGQTAQQIEAEMAPAGKLNTLQRRFGELDRVAVAQTLSGSQQRRFLGSPEEVQWRTSLSLERRVVLGPFLLERR